MIDAVVKPDWRIGMAVTPKMRTHPWFRWVGVCRIIIPESPNIKERMRVEIYQPHFPNNVILIEPTCDWMTA